MNENITLKYIRPNQKDLGHTQILFDNNVIGYMIPNKSKFRTVNQNYNIQFTFNKKKFITNVSNRQKAINFLNETIETEMKTFFK